MSGDTKAERELGTRPYFQQMSLAMALTCTGEAFVISEFPDNINYQYPGQNPSIWLTHELPALQRLVCQIPSPYNSESLTNRLTPGVDSTN
jgi:hypothetical protein